MAIYFPPYFCGVGSRLLAKKDINVEFDDGTTMTIRVGAACIVDEIIGYGFNIKSNNDNRIFRIRNGVMPDYFEIIERVEIGNDLDNSDYDYKEGEIRELVKDFEIKDVVHIKSGQTFLHFADKTDTDLYHDLYSTDGKEKMLRMKDSEFVIYFGL